MARASRRTPRLRRDRLLVRTPPDQRHLRRPPPRLRQTPLSEKTLPRSRTQTRRTSSSQASSAPAVVV
ncbi:MAG: hypothetical protein DMF95_33485 [Acidobacteria bacterium]|nr:MAG: hypothetical protein DMF95_33485 [Acidobacteriota bacterium]